MALSRGKHPNDIIIALPHIEADTLLNFFIDLFQMASAQTNFFKYEGGKKYTHSEIQPLKSNKARKATSKEVNLVRRCI